MFSLDLGGGGQQRVDAPSSWFQDGETLSEGRPSTAASFLTASEKLALTPRSTGSSHGHGQQQPLPQPHAYAHQPIADLSVLPVASLMPAFLVDALAPQDTESVAAAIMQVALLLDSVAGDDAAAVGTALREGPGLRRLVDGLGHADPRIHQSCLLVLGNLAAHEVDHNADATHDCLSALGAFARILPHARSRTPLTVAYALGAVRNLCMSIDEVLLMQSTGVLEALQALAAPHEAGADPSFDNPRLRQYAVGCLINVRQIVTLHEGRAEQPGAAAAGPDEPEHEPPAPAQ